MPEGDFAQAKLAAPLDDLLKRGDHRLGPVEAEALRARILRVEEVLEPLGLDELGEDGPLPLLGELDLLVRSLDPLLNPGFLGRVGDMVRDSNPIVPQ